MNSDLPVAAKNPPGDRRTALLGLFRRRACWMPTWRGWLAGSALSALIILGVVTLLEPFLTENDPLPTRLLVVEGWMPDFAFKTAAQRLQNGQAERALVTGGPLEKGALLAEFGTYADIGAKMLVSLGVATNLVEAIPALGTRKDRTFVSALALRRWLAERGPLPTSLNVVSLGAHSRRTRLTFQKAFGESTRIGIIAAPEERYGPEAWWRSSMGFQTVAYETISYTYARWLFRPDAEMVAVP